MGSYRCSIWFRSWGCGVDASVRQALELLASAPAAGFGVSAGAGEDTARLAQAVLERVCALRADALAEVEQSGVWRAGGSVSVAGWAGEALGLPPSEAGVVVRTARALHGELPLTRAGVWAGELSWGQASMLARTVLVTAARREAVAAPGGEAALVQVACGVPVADLPRVLACWAHGVDAAGVEAGEAQVYRQRRVGLAQTFGGAWHLEGLLDPVGGAALAAALDAVVGASLGTPGEDRTITQVRADALVDLARRALAAGQVPKAGGLRPQVFLHVQADTLTGQVGSPAAELAPGEATVSGQTARMLACDAVLTPFAWSSDGRLLDVGRSTRTVPALLRRAVVGRDRRCVFAGCRRPLTWCDAHHIVHWARGGPTRLDNLVLLCRHHHTLVHQHDLAITPATTGRGWTFTHPDGTVFHGPPGPRRRARRRWAA